MTGNSGMTDEELSSLVRDSWPEAKVSDELRASTLARIHEAAQAAPDAGEAVDERPATQVPAACRPRQATVSPLARRGWLGLAAVLLAAVLGIAGYSVYHSETAYATVSAQTQLTLGINRFNVVVSAAAGEGVSQADIDTLGLDGRTYDDAMAVLSSSGYLGSGEVDVSVDSGAADQEQALVESTTSCLGESGHSGSCNGNRYGRVADAAQDGTEAGSSDEAGATCDGECQGTGSGNGSAGEGHGMGASEH